MRLAIRLVLVAITTVLIFPLLASAQYYIGCGSVSFGP